MATFSSKDRPRDSYYYRSTGSTADRWYTNMNTGAILASAAILANRLYAIPFIVPRSIVVDRIAISVSGLELTKSVRLGIYLDSGNLTPSTLLLDAGTVSVDTDGAKAISISQSINVGVVWLALVSDGTPSLRSTVTAMTSILGFDNTLGTRPDVSIMATYSYAALPSTYPSTYSYSNVYGPMIYVRIA